MDKLEQALDLIVKGRRKASTVAAWQYAEEAAALAGVSIADDGSGRPDFGRLEADVRSVLQPQYIIVTRHEGAVAWLRQNGIEGEVIPHVTDPEAIRGKVVIGNLPMHLAACAARVGIIEMPNLPAEARGRDLSVAEMTNFGARISWYRVQKIE